MKFDKFQGWNIRQAGLLVVQILAIVNAFTLPIGATVFTLVREQTKIIDSSAQGRRFIRAEREIFGALVATEDLTELDPAKDADRVRARVILRRIEDAFGSYRSSAAFRESDRGTRRRFRNADSVAASLRGHFDAANAKRLVEETRFFVHDIVVSAGIDADPSLTVQSYVNYVGYSLPDLLYFNRSNALLVADAVRRGIVTSDERMAFLRLVHRQEFVEQEAESTREYLVVNDEEGPAFAASVEAAAHLAHTNDGEITDIALGAPADTERTRKIIAHSHELGKSYDTVFARGVDEMDAILSQRIDAQSQTRRITVLLGTIAIMLGSFIVIILTRSMIMRHRAAARSARLEADAIGMELARVTAERALRLSEAQFRRVFDVSHTGIALFDAEGNPLEHNAAYSLILESDRDAFFTEIVDRVRRFVSDPTAAWIEEAHLRRGSGATCWLELSLSGIFEDGECRMIMLTIQDVTGRKQLEERLTHGAYHDPLTNLGNRTAFEAAVNGALVEAKHGSPFTLMLIDLDHFKEVNDSLGHFGGDAVLVAAAARLKACISAHDFVARLGGDEFAVVLRGIGQVANADSVAARMQASISSRIVVKGREIAISASIGINVVACDAAGEYEAVVHAADMAMYAAKVGGRGRHAFYEGQTMESLARSIRRDSQDS